MKCPLTGHRTAVASAGAALAPQHHQMNDTTAKRKSWLSFGLYSKDSKMYSAKLKYSWFCETICKLKQKCNYSLLAKCSIFKYTDRNEVPNYPSEFHLQEGTYGYTGSKNKENRRIYYARMEKPMWKTEMKPAFAISGTKKHHTLEKTFEFQLNIELCNRKADNRIHDTLWDGECTDFWEYYQHKVGVNRCQLITSKVTNSPMTKAQKKQITRAMEDALQVFHPGLLKKNPKQSKIPHHISKKSCSCPTQKLTPKDPKPTKRKFHSQCCFVQEVVT